MNNPKIVDDKIRKAAIAYANDCGLTTWPMTDSAAVLVDAFIAGWNKGASTEAEFHRQIAVTGQSATTPPAKGADND